LAGLQILMHFVQTACIHCSCRCQTVRLVGVSCACALTAPITHGETPSLIDEWKEGRFDGGGSGVVFLVRVLLGGPSFVPVLGTCSFD
jgi:hypothetical protein